MYMCMGLHHCLILYSVSLRESIALNSVKKASNFTYMHTSVPNNMEHYERCGVCLPI